jgi:hypothetical protein
MDVEKLILSVNDHEAIYDASRREHQNRVLFHDDDVHHKTTAPLTTVIMFLYSLGLPFKVFILYFWRGKE